MKKLEATFRIVTPMFLGGADPENQNSELRVPSFKGALRFWWRALNWGKVRIDSRNDKDALEKLFFKEGEIFGTTANEKGKSNQSRVLMRISGGTIKEEINPNTLKEGLKYLLGIGLYQKGDVSRVPIKGGQDIRLSCCFRSDDKSDMEMSSVIEAITALGCMGGVGSRARRGWGSVSLHTLQSDDFDITVDAVPRNNQELIETIRKITETPLKHLPPFSAFSQESRVDIVAKKMNAWAALNDVGTIFQKYRNWYVFKKLTAKDQESHHFFPGDHDLMYDAVRGKCPEAHPKRVVFGLPHNYYFSSMKVGAEITTDAPARSRRASPLLIHIHQFPDENETSIVQTLLKSHFLPGGTNLKIQAKGIKDPFILPPQEDWQVITDYLNLFPERKEVRHEP